MNSTNLISKMDAVPKTRREVQLTNTSEIGPNQRSQIMMKGRTVTIQKTLIMASLIKVGDLSLGEKATQETFPAMILITNATGT